MHMYETARFLIPLRTESCSVRYRTCRITSGNCQHKANNAEKAFFLKHTSPSEVGVSGGFKYPESRREVRSSPALPDGRLPSTRMCPRKLFRDTGSQWYYSIELPSARFRGPWKLTAQGVFVRLGPFSSETTPYCVAKCYNGARLVVASPCLDTAY